MHSKRQRMDSSYTSPNQQTTTKNNAPLVPQPISATNTTFTLNTPIPMFVSMRPMTQADLNSMTVPRGSSPNRSSTSSVISFASQESNALEPNLTTLRLDSYEAVTAAENDSAICAPTLQLPTRRESEFPNSSLYCPIRDSPGDQLSPTRIREEATTPLLDEPTFFQNPSRVEPNGSLFGHLFMSTSQLNTQRAFHPISSQYKLNLLVEKARTLLQELRGTVNFIAPLNEVCFLHELPSEILHVIIADVSFLLSMYRAHQLPAETYQN